MDQAGGSIGPSIVLEYKNRRPMDLLDLTTALRSFAKYYHKQAQVEFSHEGAQDARLAIGRLTTSSIIAELIPIVETADWLLKHRDDVAPFVAQFGDAMNMLRAFPPAARDLPREQVRAVKDIVAPVARDQGSQLNIFASENATVITNIYNIGSNGAQSVRRHADIVLAGSPNEYDFVSEPMRLYQVRDSGKTSQGDYGFVDKFSSQPIKIRWMNDEVKLAVMDRPENVFDLVFFVTGIARTAGGEIVSYDIKRLDEYAWRPSGERRA